jgi:uncharacterized protein with ParB-like and HNH nuclease domain
MCYLKSHDFISERKLLSNLVIENMPAITSTFRSNEPSLSEVLGKIHEGVIQLPDFQRGCVWDEDHIRSLLASISLSYPVGAIMQLETGGDSVRFQPRLIAGVELAHPIGQDFLILDP